MSDEFYEEIPSGNDGQRGDVNGPGPGGVNGQVPSNGQVPPDNGQGQGQPNGPYYGNGYGGYGTPGGYRGEYMDGGNSLAVISLVFSILSILCCPTVILPVIFAVVGLVTALMSRRNKKLSGMAIASLVISIIVLLAGLAVLIYMIYLGTHPELLVNMLENLKSYAGEDEEMVKQIDEMIQQLKDQFNLTMFRMK